MKLLHTHARPPDDDYASRRGDEVVDNSSDWTRVEDNDACSFWRPSGLTYVKDQTWSITDDGRPAQKTALT
jgi:hypothetical protein